MLKLSEERSDKIESVSAQSAKILFQRIIVNKISEKNVAIATKMHLTLFA